MQQDLTFNPSIHARNWANQQKCNRSIAQTLVDLIDRVEVDARDEQKEENFNQGMSASAATHSLHEGSHWKFSKFVQEFRGW